MLYFSPTCIVLLLYTNDRYCSSIVPLLLLILSSIIHLFILSDSILWSIVSKASLKSINIRLASPLYCLFFISSVVLTIMSMMCFYVPLPFTNPLCCIFNSLLLSNLSYSILLRIIFSIIFIRTLLTCIDLHCCNVRWNCYSFFRSISLPTRHFYGMLVLKNLFNRSVRLNCLAYTILTSSLLLAYFRL